MKLYITMEIVKYITLMDTERKKGGSEKSLSQPLCLMSTFYVWRKTLARIFIKTRGTRFKTNDLYPRHIYNNIKRYN